MCKFESSPKDESRAHSADSSKAYSKLTAFNSGKYCETLMKLQFFSDEQTRLTLDLFIIYILTFLTTTR